MDVKNQIESLLFISHKPLSIKELARLISTTEEKVKQNIKKLSAEYKERQGGVQFLELNNKYQLAASGDCSEVVKKFIKGEMTGELTKPSLETLTIVAYRGPISKAELELIRGVNCSLILRNLLMRGLVEAKEDKKKGLILYNITFDFLKHLGLNKLEELPDYTKLNRNNNLNKLLAGVNGQNGITIDDSEISTSELK